MQRRPRIGFAPTDEDNAAIAAIKQHYGFASPQAALRRALSEHAKQIKVEATRETKQITFSRRVH